MIILYNAHLKANDVMDDWNILINHNFISLVGNVYNGLVIVFNNDRQVRIFGSLSNEAKDPY